MVTSRWRRWTVSIGLAITTLPLLALLVLYLQKPAGTRLVVGMLLHPLVANTRPPAMFAGSAHGRTRDRPRRDQSPIDGAAAA
jgi:hypothetical protein